MAMSNPVELSNDGSNIKATKKNHTEKKITAGNPISVISMNGSGPGVGKGTSPQTKKVIVDVIKSNKPHLLLFQEFKWKGIKSRIWKDTPLPGHYEYTGHKEASFMYDNRRLNLSVPETNLEATLEEMKRNGEVEQDFNPLARSSIRLLETKRHDIFKILVVSWHGVYIGLDKEEKVTQFKDLQIYLKKISERENVHILLGGDFNIDMSLIRSRVLPKLFKLYEYTPSHRRRGKHILDYFMASPDLPLADVGYIDLTTTQGVTIQMQVLYRLLDHDPISTKVTRGKAPKKVIPLPKTIASRQIEASERAS